MTQQITRQARLTALVLSATANAANPHHCAMWRAGAALDWPRFSWGGMDLVAVGGSLGYSTNEVHGIMNGWDNMAYGREICDFVPGTDYDAARALGASLAAQCGVAHALGASLAVQCGVTK